MSAKIQFETPENIQVAYEPAGLGTRFVAWFVDNIIMYAGAIAIFFILVCCNSDVRRRGVWRWGRRGAGVAINGRGVLQ
jgi:uncharacterized RDD family membrane protein YckC